MSARILVVDDIPANVRVLEAKLLVEYYEVLTATDGPGALDAAAHHAPDLILLDVMMPGMDGYEVCRRLKADATTRHVPVVMVTALSEVSQRVEGLQAGADDFLTKPVNDVALFARIRSLIRLKQAHDEWRTREMTYSHFGIGEDPTAPNGAEVRGSILLAMGEDEDPTLVSETLALPGHQVRCVRDAGDVRSEVARCEADLLLISDRQSGEGGTDGLRLCSQIRSDAASRHLPVLLMVHEGEDDRLAKAFEIGITDYLIRPIDRDELLARTKSQIKRKRYESELRMNYQRSLAAAVTDSLTGLNNRRYLEAHFETVEKTLAAAEKALSLLILDIDHFKAINDGHGHAAGDTVLQGIAGRIMENLRGVDTAVRYGGEEFVILLPNTSLTEARTAAERLRLSIGTHPFAIPGGETEVSVTASIGVVNVNAGEVGLMGLLDLSDDALYQAKAEGRNRVVIADGTGNGNVPSTVRRAVS